MQEITLVPQKIAKEVEDVLQSLRDEFGDNLLSLILYGSWAKGGAREDSDIDLLAIFKTVNKDTAKKVNKISSNIELRYKRDITLLPVKVDKFKVEYLPLFTAAKREGIIVFGDIDLKENPESPQVKYKDFFRKSVAFESKKVEIAEKILQDGLPSGVFSLCFVASKHLLQAGLAMKGVGFSSKVKILLPLIEKHFGCDIASSFKQLFSSYIKTEYQLHFPDKHEAILAVKNAKRIIKKVKKCNEI